MRYLALIFVFACAADDVVEPTFGAVGAADGISDVTFHGALTFGTAVDGVFTTNGQFDGYTLDVRPGGEVKLEITHGGSSMRLDTTLFVYGPRAANGAYPAAHVAYDNDAGYGKLSKLTTTLAAGGTYAVVVGTKNAKGRGKYRLVPTCVSGDCAPAAGIPLGACPAVIQSAMQQCVAEQLEHPYVDLTPRMNAAEQCADADVLAPLFDACAGGEAWCTGSFEAFYGTYAPACIRDVKNAILDDWCVFGMTYGAIAAQPSMTLLRDVRLVASSPLSAIEQQQIVSALHVSSHTDVTTVAEAFAAVDSNEIFQRHWFDSSGRRAFVSYEYGAGDNSYGQIFVTGAMTVAANITDGDILTCPAKYGVEIRDCRADLDCHAGLTCEGIANERGTCVNTGADTSPLEGSACSTTNACPLDSGLVCAGESRGGGLCGPAWQRRSFVSEPQLAIPDNQAAGVDAQVYAYGLASVDTDVWLRLAVTHPRTADLRITLANPAGTTVTVFDGTPGTNLDLAIPVLGFSGDEQVNGTWTLHVVDRAATRAGTIDRVELIVGSRWD